MAMGTVHLIRHGETHNPQGTIYGRLPGYGITPLACAAAAELAANFASISVRAIMTSPLQRARETAEQFGRLLGLPVMDEPDLIEPWTAFEGRSASEINDTVIWRTPWIWRYAYSQRLPSWGEPYFRIARRMVGLVRRLSLDGDVICVTHQTPMAMLRRRLVGEPLWPRPIDPGCTPLAVLSVRNVDGRLYVLHSY